MDGGKSQAAATPYSLANARVPLPFELWPMQADVVNDRAACPRTGLYAEVGTGKTAMATLIAVYQILIGMAHGWIVTVPPILVNQWVRWLNLLPGVDAAAYQGDPRKRAQMSLTVLDENGTRFPRYDFLVMSLDIFKRDYERLFNELSDFCVGGVIDEATAVKNVGSQNFKAVRDFFTGRPLQLLTGRPLATPADAYAYVKLLAPEIYTSQRVFDSVHVAERDFFGNVKQWQNLEILQKNMRVNAVRLLKVEVLPDLPLPIYQPMHYPLAKEHYALYTKLVEEQVLELESGGKIDATSVSKLYACMQQVILNWDHFSECPDNVAAGYDLMDEVLAEIGAGQPDGRKLIVYANYKMTMRALHRRYAKFGIEIINGETPAGQRQRIVDRFQQDPTCSAIAVNPKSGAYGIDGLQHVCCDVLFLEEPVSPVEFEQAVGRVYRPGQKNPPLIRIAVAEKTVQERLHRLLLNKDELTTFVQGGWKNLREAMYGA